MHKGMRVFVWLVAGAWIERNLSRWPRVARLLRVTFITSWIATVKLAIEAWNSSTWPHVSSALVWASEIAATWWWIAAVAVCAYLVLEATSSKEQAMKRFEALVDWLSGQPILDWRGTNGGDVVIARAALVTLWLLLVVLGLKVWIGPEISFEWSIAGVKAEIVSLAGWIAGFFGAAYLALYTRFVSQWSYLANVYNLIKQAESAQGANASVIAEWKAGFLEDADHLHLVGKRSLAPVIKHWAEDRAVVDAFLAATPGGQVTLDKIRRRASALYVSIALSEGSL